MTMLINERLLPLKTDPTWRYRPMNSVRYATIRANRKRFA